MANLSSFGVNSLRSQKEDGTIINMADIQDIKIRSGSLMGRVTLSATATAIRIGSANLTNRHTLNIINDSSTIIFIDLNSAVNTATSFLINSGSGHAIPLDPTDDITIWGITTENETNISIWELK